MPAAPTRKAGRGRDIVRSTFSIFLVAMLLLGGVTASAADTSPDALVQRGLDSYRAARYQDAANDLNAAAQAFLSADQMQKYVDTGRFENLARLETALVYLALAESKLKNDSAARDAILRLTSAERIEPLYANLPLQADAADFEALVKRVAPGTSLGPNVYLARGGAPSTLPPQVAQTAPPAPSPAPSTPSAATPTTPSAATPTTAQSASAAVLTPSPSKPAVPPPTQAAQATPVPAQTERERYIEQRLAEERAKIEKAADERIAAERAAAQKSAAEQIAAAQKNAQLQIEAAQKKAQEQIAAAQRDAEQRIAAAQKAGTRTDYLASVREADSLAIKGKVDAARRMYAIVANAPDAGRDVLAEAAVGLYRTGGFRDAVNAFRRVAPFARGEEDLRFYNAVSLYESGNYTDAKKELACALPYIERSDDVSRYQTRIDLTGTE